MKKLTKAEEREILEQALALGEFISTGSSRAVFGLDETRVLKVAASVAGYNQNKIETELFANYGDNGFLARIHGFSERVTIMDRMEQVLDDYYHEGMEIDEDRFDEIYDFLNSENGSTSDNEQIGIDTQGNMVAYDYGFISIYKEGTDYSFEDLVGNIDSKISGKYDGDAFGLLRDMLD